LAADLYQDFRQAVDRSEDKIDLGRAALTIAISDYSELDVAGYLSRIDELAARVRARLGTDPDVHSCVAALNRVLFQEYGFRGNRENYYDPRNSFLNEVLDRKTGIPISLSVVYMEVAQRIGLRLQGVGFPGHFLTKYRGNGEEIVIDPFNAGEIRSRESLENMLYKLYGEKIPFHADFLAPLTTKQILRRMLTNLKMIYLRDNQPMKALSAMERLVILDPVSAEDIRERGVLYMNLECFTQALEDLRTYLRLAPEAQDAGAVREQIVKLTKQVAQIH
jgi:regulator of sirC expression with transglutaminase-like and TPR domain